MNNIDTTKYTAHQHPGKFEGESAATEYFYEQMLNGDGEEIYESQFRDTEYYDYDIDLSATIFTVQADEPEAFGLNHGDIFMIREDSQGFVYGSVHASRAEAEAKFRNWLGLSGTTQLNQIEQHEN